METIAQGPPFRLTIAAGLRNTGRVEPTTFANVAELAELFDCPDDHLDVEGWWSPHVYDGRRVGDDWVEAWGVAVDIDGPAKPQGQPLPDLDLWIHHINEGDVPGTFFHPTKSGMRVGFLFLVPVKNAEVWKRCAKGACALVEQAMKKHDLLGEVDPHVVNLGNLNWLPNTTDEKGATRQADTIYGEIRYNPRRLLKVNTEEGLFAAKTSPPESPTRASGGPTLRDRRVALEALLRLGPKHAIDRPTWIKVGMALHWAYEGHDAGWAAWDAWSKQAHNYGRTQYDWDRFKPGGGITNGWLIEFVRKNGSKRDEPFAWEGGEEALAELSLRKVGQTSLPIQAEGDADASQTFRLRSIARFLAACAPLVPEEWKPRRIDDDLESIRRECADDDGYRDPRSFDDWFVGG